ncbi:MAG: ribonuclease HI family protein [Candidatus Sumerlaeaceae bacterium]|nr:ribonuclease HI family protein [Candidatus Sumerlaeaceae bacterium]
MPLDRNAKELLRKALKIRDSEVPLYRVLDILATQEGNIEEVISRYHDIRNRPLRAAFHYCAELMRYLAKTEGLLPTWEVDEPSTDDFPPTRDSETQKKSADRAAKKKKPNPELVPFIDESARGRVKVAKAYIDGASRGNPGPAGIGVAIFAMNGTKIAQQEKSIGKATNNIAEYTALIEALKLAQDLGIEEIYVLSDSELLVRQMNGEYKIKNAELLAKAMEARAIANRFKKFSVSYITRENNKLADALSNHALDFSPEELRGEHELTRDEE